MKASDAVVTVKATGRTLRFSGVTALRITQSVKLAAEGDAENAKELVNGARNMPTRIVLTVVESDVSGSGRCRETLAALTALRASRGLCALRTALMDCDSLLLTECAVTRDEAGPFSWTGTLTFTEAGGAPESGGTGLAAPRRVTVTEAPLARAGLPADGGPYLELPVTAAPEQELSVAATPGGLPLQARITLRWQRGAERWLFSLRDDAAGTELARRLPLLCGDGAPEDLLAPFRHLRGGRGLGCLYCVPRSGRSGAQPAEGTLPDFRLLWGDGCG